MTPRRPLHTFAALTGALVLSCLVISCESSGPRGIPKKLPVVHLYDTPATPAHSMSHGEYPFDANGAYMSAWAAEGERLAGRGPGSDSDISSWSASHGGSVSRRQPSPVKKVPSSKSKSSKSGSSSSYTIKSGDTLSAIARKHNTTVAKIKAANGLKSDLIHPGKALKIPR